MAGEQKKESEGKEMTNGDRIRQMTDEEIAALVEKKKRLLQLVRIQ